MDYSSRSVTSDPFLAYDIDHTSRLLPTTLGNFHLLCGPRDDDVKMHKTIIDYFPLSPVTTCLYKKTGDNIIVTRFEEKWSVLQRDNGYCDNIVLYKNLTCQPHEKVLFYLTQDSIVEIPNFYSMDVIVSGKYISVADHGINAPLNNPPWSRYHFPKELDYCSIYKEGLNLIYIKHNGSFSCDLGGRTIRQTNVAVIQGGFKDVSNIHSIIGSDESDLIDVSHAEYVDGKGGGDIIQAHRFTTVKGYYGDLIYGKTMTLLPMSLGEVHKIIANDRIVVYNRHNESIQVNADSFLQTNDGFFIKPMKINNVTHLVTHVYVHKYVNGDVVLKKELAALKRIKPTQYHCTKHMTSHNYDIVLSDNDHTIFHPNKNNHNFYWETTDDKNHLYLFDSNDAQIVISRAKGLLDFSKLNYTAESSGLKLKILDRPRGSLHIALGSLHVDLLKNRRPVKITFNGQEYFNIAHGKLKRNYCTHSLKVNGRLTVDGNDLFNHYNCFEFQTDKVMFLKHGRDLLLLSGFNILTVTNFYPLVHQRLDLALKLKSSVVEPKKFREKANCLNPFRIYEPIDGGLSIYHNQPIDRSRIGMIYSKDSSILDYEVNLQGDDLLLANRNVPSVLLANWNNRQAAREMMFAFNDSLITNAKCVLFNCNPQHIVEEFQRQKTLVGSSVMRRKRTVFPGITGNKNYDLSNALNHNVNLALFFLQNFLDKTCPLPRFRSFTEEEIYACAENITQSFQEKLYETSRVNGIDLKDWNSFQLYTDVVQHLRNEEFSKISSILVSAVDRVLNLNSQDSKRS